MARTALCICGLLRAYWHPMKTAIRNEIRSFVRECSLGDEMATTWGEPLVGFVDSSDPIFQEIRAFLGERHALPSDLMPAARSVVALFAPYSRALAASNRPGPMASRAWCVAFDETQRLLAALGDHLGSWLAERGYRLTAVPDSHAFDPERVVADWSHKHAAVAAGLGRPGHHTMLITKRGCFGRVCSFLTDVPLRSDPRPRHEPCLRLSGGSCGRCVERCVGDALHEDRYDPHACYAQCLRNEGRFPDLPVTDLCGKCMVGVPCSRVDPSRPGAP
jgi:epoxyqueuosine reductase QueG